MIEEMQDDTIGLILAANLTLSLVPIQKKWLSGSR